jgi:hypothetical protein
MLVRFLVTHVLVGFGIAAVFVAGFVVADPGGGGTLLTRAAGHWWPVVVLWFFVGLTFGSAQIGAATMLLAERPDRRRPGGGLRLPVFAPFPVRIRAGRR